MVDMTRRFKKLSKAIVELVVDDDAFGLIKGELFTFNKQVPKQAWRFQNDATKLRSYRMWLKQQVDAYILSPVGGGVGGKPWTAPYIESAYKKGSLRAYTDLRAEKMISKPVGFRGGREEFIHQTFGQPEVTKKIELLYTRAFHELDGVTAAMDQKMGRVLADGLAHGHGPKKIARALTKIVSNMNRTRALVIARTEIIRAHAEGQLDAFERLGEKEVGVMAEWSTAGDDRVCISCEDMEGEVMTIAAARGLLPLHPNCRCAWIPAQKARKAKARRIAKPITPLPTKKRKVVKRKKATKEAPKKNLTEDELEAVDIWKNPEKQYFKDIVAWDANHTLLKSTNLKRVPFHHDQLRNAMDKIGATQTTAYRGLGLSDTELGKIIVGDTIKTTRLTSFSGNVGIAEDFAINTMKSRSVLVEAKLKTAVDISPYGDLKEAEFLITKNKQLKVMSMESIEVKGSDIIKIIVEEL